MGKLKELEVKEKYQIEITNRFAALENLNVDEDVNLVWENIKENLKTAAKESLVPEPSAFEVELAIEKLKNYKSPGTDQIPAELIKAGGRTICCEIHKLIISIWNKEELPDEWKESIIVPIYKKGDKTDCNNYRAYHYYQLCTKFCPTSCFQG